MLKGVSCRVLDNKVSHSWSQHSDTFFMSTILFRCSFLNPLPLQQILTCMDFLAQLGIQSVNPGASTGTQWIDSKATVIRSSSPVDGKLIGTVQSTDEATYQRIVQQSAQAFEDWRQWPAPKRGEIVRQVGEALRMYKEPLGKLVSYEIGKSLQEGY